jgi:hypothetical protein
MNLDLIEKKAKAGVTVTGPQVKELIALIRKQEAELTKLQSATDYEQAYAWRKVCAALNSCVPDWLDRDENGADCAVLAIKALAAPQQHATEACAKYADSLSLAKAFHEAYERLAPQVGYETRQETRAFDPESANGRLMIAVCAEIKGALQPQQNPQSAMQDLMPKRAAFIAWVESRSIDASVEKDAWGAQIFKHPHVQSMWEGWFNAPSGVQQHAQAAEDSRVGGNDAQAALSEGLPPLPDEAYGYLTGNSTDCGQDLQGTLAEAQAICDLNNTAEADLQAREPRYFDPDWKPSKPEPLFDSCQMRAYAIAARQLAPVAAMPFDTPELRNKLTEYFAGHGQSDSEMVRWLEHYSKRVKKSAVEQMLETNQLDELGEEVARLQKALCFWLPSVTDREDEVALRILEDAFLLVGIDGNIPDDFKSAQELGWVSLVAPVAAAAQSDPFEEGKRLAHGITVAELKAIGKALTEKLSTDYLDDPDGESNDYHAGKLGGIMALWREVEMHLSQSPAAAAPVDAKPFAWFVQPSGFGPYIETGPHAAGAFPAYHALTNQGG